MASIEETKIFGEIVEKWLYQNKLLKKQSLVYHYTDISALLNGIIVPNPKKNEEICLWATRCLYMNDKKEMQEGVESIKDILSKMNKNSKPLIDLLLKDVGNGHSISFSMEKDSLPMWDMYGERASGVMLAFDKEFLNKAYDFYFTSCIYTDSYHHKITKQRIKDKDYGLSFSKLSDRLQTTLMRVLYDLYIMLLKNKSFHYEKEVRIIGLGTILDKKHRETKYRKNKNGIIVPYVEEFFPKDALKEVWLGPNQDMELSAESLKEFLRSKGFDKTAVYKSTIPFRG